MKRVARFWLAAFLLVWLAGCGEQSAEEVADEFLFRYFIELNQQGALELSSGLAAKKLEEEIELLSSVRREPGLELAQHKPFLDYERVRSKPGSDQSLTFYYDVIIENPGGPEYKREVVLTAALADGVWKITNYDTYAK